MTFLQRLLTSMFPGSWADDMEAESRRWMVRCSCGFERSLWDLGGIRWKAKGGPLLGICVARIVGSGPGIRFITPPRAMGQAEGETMRSAPSWPTR